MAPIRVLEGCLRPGATTVALLLATSGAHARDAEAPGTVGERGVEPLVEIVATEAARRGRLRIDALVTSEAIHRVDFLLDDELVATDRRFPFSATVAAPSRGGGRLEARAFDLGGRELARDLTRLDGPRASLRVRGLRVRPIEGPGWLEIGADVDHPPGIDIERVDFYRDGRYVASVGSSPYRTRIPMPGNGGYLSAVALSREGEVAEGVHLLGTGTQADTVSVGLVELYAMVSTPSGEPVAGLRRDNFELVRGGATLPIERFSEGDAVPLSVALVIDRSGSMIDSMEEAVRSARHFLESTLDASDRALLIDFDSRPRLRQSRTDDLETLLAHLTDFRSRGGSAVYDAVLFGALRLERAPSRRALIVITDGLDSGSRISPADCAAMARRAGVPIFVLELGEGAYGPPTHSALALRRLAETTGGSLHTIRGPADVAPAFRSIELQLRGQYLLGFSAGRVLTRDELDALTVRVAGDSLRVRTILGGRVQIPD